MATKGCYLATIYTVDINSFVFRPSGYITIVNEVYAQNWIRVVSYNSLQFFKIDTLSPFRHHTFLRFTYSWNLRFLNPHSGLDWTHIIPLRCLWLRLHRLELLRRLLLMLGRFLLIINRLSISFVIRIHYIKCLPLLSKLLTMWDVLILLL